MNKRKVTVVIPMYNAEKYVETCILATLEQTYKNIEIIVVDDGSKDSSVNICKELQYKDSRLKVIENRHAGVSHARNTGIAEAQGDFVVFFDADDVPEIRLIEQYMDAIEQTSEEVSFWLCGMFWDNETHANVMNECMVLEVAHNYIPGKNYVLERNKAAMLEWLHLLNFVTNKIYRTEDIRKYNLKFDDTISIGEDLKFNMDYLNAVPGKIGVVNSPLYHYVRRERNSLSLSFYPECVEHTKDVYRELIAWQSIQEGTTNDDIAVLKGIFAMDWISRITAAFEAKEYEPSHHKRFIAAEKEIRTKEFQNLIKDAYRNKKMSRLRYWTLRTRHFGIFYSFRAVYQFLKG